MAEPVEAPIAKTDLRTADLQTQIDDLRLALTEWRRTREYSKPTQERLLQITMQCARLVESWQEMERRRNGGGAGLDERRLERAGLGSRTSERIHALEQAIEQEWESLPQQDSEESTRRLSEQAVSLAESCVTAANLALRGFASAESRLAALERDIQTGMAQLSRDLQVVLTELRAARPSLPAANAAFPLEGVMRIHQELRDSGGTAAAAGQKVEADAPQALPQASEATTALAARVDSLERAVESASDAPGPTEGWWRPRYAAIALLAVLAGAAVFGVWLQRRVDARLSEAELRVAAAERERDATVSSTREEAARQVAEARETAAQAQIVANVLAAPDLVRYWLTGPGTDSRAYAQVLFSRSRGMVFSASRLEPAGAGKTYQLWLLTREGPVSAGMMTPDSAGRATFVADVPFTVPGRLTGAMVTLEPAGGRSQPTGEKALVRVE